MEIQTFSPRYTQGVANLIVPIQQEEFGIAITYEDQPDLQDIPGYYQKEAGSFWVAVDDDTVVGSIALLDIGDGKGALRKMFVAPTHRGARYGTAKQLLKTLLAHARERKLVAIYLGTTDKFLAAHRFYEKHGFELIVANMLPLAFPRMSVDSRFYWLEL